MSSISGEQARRIRVVLLDADGVMTDGGLYVSADEERVTEARRFHVHDGLGIHMLRRADLVVAVVSGKVSAPVRRRAEALGIFAVSVRPGPRRHSSPMIWRIFRCFER
jgi:3-deoxy-D-manno-octulosonate 8-phosphate phosphatase (KDO 8-P phosphatase)